MIAVFLSSIGAQVAPPPPATTVTAKQLEIRGSFHAEPEVMPAVRQYRSCVDGPKLRQPVYPDTIVAATEARLAECTAERATATRVGENALKAAGWSRKKRAASVAATFDGLDASERSMAVQMRAMMIKADLPKAE